MSSCHHLPTCFVRIEKLPKFSGQRARVSPYISKRERRFLQQFINSRHAITGDAPPPRGKTEGKEGSRDSDCNMAGLTTRQHTSRFRKNMPDFPSPVRPDSYRIAVVPKRHPAKALPLGTYIVCCGHVVTGTTGQSLGLVRAALPGAAENIHPFFTGPQTAPRAPKR
jgi:hypothetical protein